RIHFDEQIQQPGLPVQVTAVASPGPVTKLIVEESVQAGGLEIPVHHQNAPVRRASPRQQTRHIRQSHGASGAARIGVKSDYLRWLGYCLQLSRGLGQIAKSAGMVINLSQWWGREDGGATVL